MKTKSFIPSALQPFADLISKLFGGGQIKFCQLKFLLIALAFFSGLSSGMTKLAAQTDTMICDNGGFEDDFDYYFGETTLVDSGARYCEPYYEHSSVVWNSASLPTFRRFEIVSSGVDTLVGINRTKFGNKALLLNNRYGHTGNICGGRYGLDKIIKRFKVTEENKDFTVWFAAVLENPLDHTNTQPFFSIRCDRAPESDLCFDASLIECEAVYQDSICKDTMKFDTVIVVDWTCHRIKISDDFIDSIATLEIMAADCGQSAHFGYAYIDGICEECDGSAFGSASLYDHDLDVNGLGIDHKSCEGDTLRVCGSYALPTICGNWYFDSLNAPGFTLYNLTIDTINNVYCFDLALSEFLEDTCRDLYVAVYFSSDINILPPVYSNSINICTWDFEKNEIEVITGVCQDNNTSDMLSDDYYYVQVDLSHLHGDTFTIERQLDEPYPNESGHYILKADTGDGTFNLGPFFIQEGSWILTVKVDSCITDTFYITPPYFCSTDCNKFLRTRIFDVACADATPGTSTPADDTWSFKISVQGTAGQTYKINGAVGPPYYYNSNYTISVGIIGLECEEFTLQDVIGGCMSKIMVCPPKPCSNNEECELEVYLKEITCNEAQDEFYIEVDTSGVGSAYLCWKESPSGTPTSFSNPIGPFTNDVYVTFYLCNSSACNCEPACFKTIYFPFPDCDNLDYRSKGKKEIGFKYTTEVIVIPNPINSAEMIIRSTLKKTIFEIYDSGLKSIYSGIFSGTEYRLPFNVPSGVYFLRYKQDNGRNEYIKVIKL